MKSTCEVIDWYVETRKDGGLREVVLHGGKNEPKFYEFGSRHICTGDAERNDLPCCQG